MRLRISSEQIDAARTGDAAHIERLLEAVWPDAYRLARAIVPQRHAAEDAAQEACVTIFRHIGTLRRSDSFGTWFYRIVVREALKQKKAGAAASSFEPEAAYSDDPAQVIDLWRALDALTDKLRAVVVLHYFEGLPGREIAGILRVPHATVRFRLMAARRRLQRDLETADSTADSKGDELYAH